jgi:hypothetical protein
VWGVGCGLKWLVYQNMGKAILLHINDRVFAIAIFRQQDIAIFNEFNTWL